MNNIIEPLKNGVETFATHATKTGALYKQFLLQALLTSILFMVTLAWNAVVQEIIDVYYPLKTDKPIRGKLYYALGITFVVIMMQIYLFPYITDDTKFIKK